MQLRKHICALGIHLLNENMNILKKNSEVQWKASKKLCLDINAKNSLCSCLITRSLAEFITALQILLEDEGFFMIYGGIMLQMLIFLYEVIERI